MDGFKEKIKKLLRRTEPYMKTDMVYLASGGFWLSLGQGISLAVGLLLVVGFANILPKDIYGNYKFILSLAGIISAFTLSGMGTAVTQAIARGRDGAFRTGFHVKLKWSAFMTVVAFAVSAYYFLNGNRTVGISLLIVGALSPIIESASLYGSYLNGKRDFKRSAKYNALRNIVTATILLVTILLTHNVALIILSYFLSQVAISVTLYLAVLKRYRPPHDTDYSNITFSKHLSVTNILSIIALNLDKILIFHFLGAVDVAIYSIALAIPAQLKILLKMFGALALPKMSAVSLKRIRSAIFSKAWRLFVAFGAVVVLLIAVLPPIYRVIFPQYPEAILISQGLALGYIFSPAVLYSQTFIALKKQKEIYLIKILTAGTRIMLLLILLPLFGIWGAVYALFLARGISFMVSVILFRRLE